MDVAKVCVVGAGIIGVSTAINIIEHVPNVQVTIVAETFSPDTTSDGVAGYVKPYLCGDTPRELIVKWYNSTIVHLLNILKTPESDEIGVHLKSGYCLHDNYKEEPFWKDICFNFKCLSSTEIEALFSHVSNVQHGWHFSTIFCQPVHYIPWIMKRFTTRGGKTIKQSLTSLREISDLYDVIVVCTGVGSKQLVGDNEVFPVKGQLVTVTNPGLTEFVDLSSGTDTHMFPFKDYICCGGITDANNWTTTTDPEVDTAIIERCTKIVPSLKNAKILGSWAGLRPGRSSVRLEREDLYVGSRKKKVVYNYGHGGSGVTLHWGCAQDAAELVSMSISEQR